MNFHERVAAHAATFSKTLALRLPQLDRLEPPSEDAGRFIEGKPCKRCGTTTRYAKSSQRCVKCHSQRTKAGKGAK